MAKREPRRTPAHYRAPRVLDRFEVGRYADKTAAKTPG
jgi:hypothetical protein